MAGTILDREEYVEQEYFFRVYRERLQQNIPSQEILKTIQEEILATTRLPMAVDFLRAEILHNGRISDGMIRLSHYFTAFQAFVIQRSEADDARFDQVTALRILESEAHYRSNNPVPAGLFIYQFECIARNRLGYNDGLSSMAEDPLYGPEWADWIRRLQGELGTRELADVVYRASLHFQKRRQSVTRTPLTSIPADSETATEESKKLPVLFGDQEGRIARANLGRDPLYFFAALQRQLNYPAIPRAPRRDDSEKLSPALEARLQKIEQRLKLVEMEQRGGIDLSAFYRNPENQDFRGPRPPEIPS